MELRIGCLVRRKLALPLVCRQALMTDSMVLTHDRYQTLHGKPASPTAPCMFSEALGRIIRKFAHTKDMESSSACDSV